MPEKWVALNISISGMMAAAVGGDGCVSSSEDVECKQPVSDVCCNLYLMLDAISQLHQE